MKNKFDQNTLPPGMGRSPHDAVSAGTETLHPLTEDTLHAAKVVAAPARRKSASERAVQNTLPVKVARQTSIGQETEQSIMDDPSSRNPNAVIATLSDTEGREVTLAGKGGESALPKRRKPRATEDARHPESTRHLPGVINEELISDLHGATVISVTADEIPSRGMAPDVKISGTTAAHEDMDHLSTQSDELRTESARRRSRRRRDDCGHEDDETPATLKPVPGIGDRILGMAMVAAPGIPTLRPPKMQQGKPLPALRTMSRAECERRCGADGFCDPSNIMGCGGLHCGRQYDGV